MITPNLLKKYPIISDQIGAPALSVVLGELEKVLNSGVDGAVVEFGCYIGTASLFIRRLMDELDESGKRGFHTYDSFEGLPEKLSEDQSAAGVNFKAGELKVSKKQFLKEFYKANLRPPSAHKAWFENLNSEDLPKPLAFAFLDGDFYESILKSLELVWPHLSDGAVVCIDDYGRETLPGVERAVKQFFGNRPPKISVAHDIAVLKN